MKKIISKQPFAQPALIVGLGLFAMLNSSCGNGGGTNADSTSNQARTQEQILTEVETVKAIGKVVPAEDWVILSAAKTGQVTQVLVREGDTVKAGQLLVELDPSTSGLNVEEAKARLSSLRADLRAAEADLRQAEILSAERQAKFSTTRRLFQAGAETRETLLTDSSAWEQQRALVSGLQQKLAAQRLQIAEQQIQIQKAENEYGDYSITAPKDGIVVDLNVKAGQTLNVSSEIGKLVEPSKTVIEAEVDELFANEIQVGQSVHLRSVGRTDSVGTGTVHWVSPILSDKSILYETANEGQDRRVRKIRITPDASKPNKQLPINAKVDCEINIR